MCACKIDINGHRIHARKCARRVDISIPFAFDWDAIMAAFR